MILVFFDGKGCKLLEVSLSLLGFSESGVEVLGVSATKPSSEEDFRITKHFSMSSLTGSFFPLFEVDEICSSKELSMKLDESLEIRQTLSSITRSLNFSTVSHLVGSVTEKLLLNGESSDINSIFFCQQNIIYQYYFDSPNSQLYYTHKHEIVWK